MQVKLLGAHQGDSRDIHFMSILIDGRLPIDAGGLTSGLTLGQQRELEAILITHRHYDHIKDLGAFAFNLWQTRSLQIFALQDVIQALQSYIFNQAIWPVMQEATDGRYPLIYRAIEPDVPFQALGYNVQPLPVSHTVPCVGYFVERGGKSIFYTADARSEGHPSWAAVKPDLVLAETTFSNDREDEAFRFGHMTPKSLGQELHAFHRSQGYYPRVVCVHINPDYQQQITIELAALSQELGADITAGYEGMVIEV